MAAGEGDGQGVQGVGGPDAARDPAPAPFGRHERGRIAEEFPVAKSTLSGHLNVLKEANLVVAERSGTTITYSLNVGVYEEMLGP
ncbi:ArsR family transcriptional regulator [Rubrobacter marinus]|uniref:ArsR family transcriptional regulator n=1 Tax=Rubrobacter marinus TaxID=2653852 RepID=UPI001D18ABD1|nr:ArsR family transcriptional regulator [Rubrobacter marinus]